MKVKEIQSMYKNLKGMSDKKLPIKMSFVIIRNLKKLEEVVADIDAKQYELIQRYGEKKEDGTLCVAENGDIKVTDIAGYLQETNELYNTEIDIHLDAVTEEDIVKCDADGYDKLTVEEVGALKSMSVSVETV